jgi:hypothetical protein
MDSDTVENQSAGFRKKLKKTGLDRLFWFPKN